MLASSCFGQDAALLDLLVEASQGCLEGLVLTDSDFCQLGNHLPLVDIRPHSTAGTRTDGEALRESKPHKQAGAECSRAPEGWSNGPTSVTEAPQGRLRTSLAKDRDFFTVPVDVRG